MTKDLMKYIISLLIVITIMTAIFSAWRVYSTEAWLDEMKIYVQKSVNEIKAHQEEVAKKLLISNREDEENKKLLKELKKEIKRND